MGNEDDFEPKLGRQRSTGGKAPDRYGTRVAKAAGLLGRRQDARSRGFDGSRIGRGAAMGRLLSSRGRPAGHRGRRVVVKTRLGRLAGKGLGAARAHLHYIQRDGVTREGQPGQLYGPETDRADGKDFIERSGGDRHQFRLIVSAEEGDRFEDLKPVIRRLMEQVGEDLGTKLDWVAVDHFNTGHPHTHVVLRGVDDQGKDLVIAREYMAHGFRERAAEIVSLELGPRTEHEIEARLRMEMDQERLTSLDRRLLGRMSDERVVSPSPGDPAFHALETGRLRTLQRMELAQDIGAGKWQLAAGLVVTLRQMGERGDIIRQMQREVTRAKLERAEQRIFAPEHGPLVGRVVARGLADEDRDRHFLVVDGADGRAHYADIGSASAVDQLPKGATVRITPRSSTIRIADRTVLEVAKANEGRYSPSLHRRYDPQVSEAFAETHVRRLEAMRRARMGPEREPDGSWRISPDHLKQAERFEQRLLAERPVEVEVLSREPIGRLAGVEGASWLDRELASPSGLQIRDGGFGRELRAAMEGRRQWLVEQGLAEGQGENFKLQQNALAVLQRRELLRLAAGLRDELGKEYFEVHDGQRIEGRIARRIDGVSGHYALVEKSREFTLVPWRPVLEKQIGQQGGGIMRETGINWHFGRGRAGPEIS
ncbi:type IV secretory pathway VirD2 relaxase [Novosphingobium sp. PhB55]|uniref:relaxase/mobilization nuclease RlxS n=1 Tax=Novosphingobium sp. PhB55 TaxID=2485106 RepID=UPI0010648A5D|nr:relaxase/mobilization nuclease RlxS [Novosphingobium sp. PhB55]TDW61585.1 type IV secretory pathway VirD2 relaxase [Novosphingobium sp. PhB55]